MDETAARSAGTPPPLVDTHVHLIDPKLARETKAVCRRAAEAGVARLIAVGTTAEDSVESIGLARQFPGQVVAAVGIHPNHAAEAGPADWDRVAALARSTEVVAIGETGLDRHWDFTPFSLQQDYFERHLVLAHELGRPVIIHSRECMGDVIGQLRGLGRTVSGVLHSFTGTWDEAVVLLDLGLHISFTGMITYKKQELDALREVAARLPLDRILVETDAPYLSPEPFRGRVNEPARVVHTARKIADLRGLDFAEFAEATTANASRLFGLVPS
jgi:TatD DNase family protein